MPAGCCSAVMADRACAAGGSQTRLNPHTHTPGRGPFYSDSFLWDLGLSHTRSIFTLTSHLAAEIIVMTALKESYLGKRFSIK